MDKMVSKLQEKRAKGDQGFTLIELLVVVVILGVLIAIAIPLYLNYRKGANDSATQSDVRNTISVMEICQSQNNAYPVYTSSVAATPCGGQNLNLSAGTSMTYISAAAGVSYVILANNTNGSGKYYCYNSSKGGAVKALDKAPDGAPAATLASC